MINAAQKATLRRIRSMPRDNGGSHEIAATRMSGDVLHMFFETVRVAILPDGSYCSQRYGKERLFGLVVNEVKRPVDLLAD